jgi:hypothetical protein
VINDTMAESGSTSKSLNRAMAWSACTSPISDGSKSYHCKSRRKRAY